MAGGASAWDLAWGRFRSAGKRRWEELKDFFNDKEASCVVCRNEFTLLTSSSLAAQYFCSGDCYRSYLIRERNDKQRGKCLKSGCNRCCYVDEDRTHDYCGLTHAKEHSQWIASLWLTDTTRDGCHSNGPSQPPSGHAVRRKGHLLGPSHGGSSGPIRFYNRGEPYFEFTNFAEFPIVINEVQYPTSEHYFQSQKLIGTPFVAQICKLPTARQAFEFLRRPIVSQWIRHDWHSVKEDVMYRALVEKFRQYRHLQFMLLSTGDRILVEHSPYDSYWGDGPDGNGLNRLGELLMRVRELLNFVRDHGEHALQEDHPNVPPPCNCCPVHCANSSPPCRYIEGDGNPSPPARDGGCVSRNDGTCSSSTSEGCIGLNEDTSTQMHVDDHTSSTPKGPVGADREPPPRVNHAPGTPGGYDRTDKDSSSQVVGHTASTPEGHVGAGEHNSPQAAQPSTESMDIDRDNGGGAPSGSQGTNESDPSPCSSNKQSKDIVDLQMEKELEEMEMETNTKNSTLV